MKIRTRPLQGGALAVAVLNVGGTRYAGTHPFHLELAKPGLHGTQQGEDLWTGQAVTLNDHPPIALHSHDVWMVRIPQPHG